MENLAFNVKFITTQTLPLKKTNLSIFAQIIRKIQRDIIHKIVDDRDSDFNSKGINDWTHLVSIVFKLA